MFISKIFCVKRIYSKLSVSDFVIFTVKHWTDICNMHVYKIKLFLIYSHVEYNLIFFPTSREVFEPFFNTYFIHVFLHFFHKLFFAYIFFIHIYIHFVHTHLYTLFLNTLFFHTLLLYLFFIHFLSILFILLYVRL